MPEETLVSYGGLGAVVAREQSNQLGSNVKGPSLSAGVIIYSGEGPGVFFTTGMKEGISGGLIGDLTISQNMNAFNGRSYQACLGHAVGSVCGSANSSGKSVSVSAGHRGGPAMPANATIGQTVTHKLTWKDVKDAPSSGRSLDSL